MLTTKKINYIQISVRMFIYLLIHIVVYFLFLEIGVHGGGTGDREEGAELTDLFLWLCLNWCLFNGVFQVYFNRRSRDITKLIRIALYFGYIIFVSLYLIFQKVYFGDLELPYDEIGLLSLKIKNIFLIVLTSLLLLLTVYFIIRACRDKVKS